MVSTDLSRVIPELRAGVCPEYPPPKKITLKIKFSNSAKSFLSIYPKDRRILIQKNICDPMFIAKIFTT